MFAVYFFENKNLLLSQLLKRVPSEGEDLTIKGRKGKVSSVNIMDEKNIHVHVILESITNNKLLVENSLKKKGK
jgi:predicted phosphatase